MDIIFELVITGVVAIGLGFAVMFVLGFIWGMIREIIDWIRKSK